MRSCASCPPTLSRAPVTSSQSTSSNSPAAARREGADTAGAAPTLAAAAPDAAGAAKPLAVGLGSCRTATSSPCCLPAPTGPLRAGCASCWFRRAQNSKKAPPPPPPAGCCAAMAVASRPGITMLLLDSRERAHTRGARRSHCSKVIAGRLRPLRALVLLQKAPWAVRVPSVRVHVQHTSQKMPQRRDWAHGDAARRSPTAALRLHHHRGGGQVCTGTAPRHPPQVMQQPCGEAAPAPTSAPPVARSKEEALQACMEQHRESARAGGVRQGACACLRPPPDTLLPPHTPLQSRSSPVSAPARPGLHLWGAVTRSTARSGTATSSSGCVRGKGGEGGGVRAVFAGRAGARSRRASPPPPQGTDKTRISSWLDDKFGAPKEKQQQQQQEQEQQERREG